MQTSKLKMTDQINKFLKCVMHSDYRHDDDGVHSKYSNDDFDIIIQKKKTKTLIGSSIDSCIVIDKRTRPILYNNISIAMKKYCK